MSDTAKQSDEQGEERTELTQRQRPNPNAKANARHMSWVSAGEGSSEGTWLELWLLGGMQ
ncbi:hypothetical protein N7448_007318 [Penicillium atrosanguineum]|uniref:uncharacterized protein n=1 Tax=Penicillium atrosanguineum TaxID=1132637 RepID=UPI002394DED0|nr:uncharacterized protein N7443_001652 [Penicillium atrosanguineum]KAJ5126539.1 hypothetical protein N7448_007318 [Penicillium atrosanguineum]KAJ5314768.1 hypothetical protein N7443_001652 [Penicillium atrosanguineum]